VRGGIGHTTFETVRGSLSRIAAETADLKTGDRVSRAPRIYVHAIVASACSTMASSSGATSPIPFSAPPPLLPEQPRESLAAAGLRPNPVWEVHETCG